PRVGFNASLLSGRNYEIEDIETAVVRRLEVLEDRVFVELRVRRRVIAAVEVVVVILDAVIGKWIGTQLAADYAVTVGEGGEEQGVDIRPFLEDIEHLLHAFIEERDGADLNADDLFL